MKLSDASWIAPLLAQVAEGKTLQYQTNDAKWIDHGYAHIMFSAAQDRYRIKPEPRAVWVIYTPSGSLYTVRHCEKAAKTLIGGAKGYTSVKFVEELP